MKSATAVTNQPVIWSDLDGTAVELAKTRFRKLCAYPLADMEGYKDFLEGASSGNVEVAGIVSARPNMLHRRIATALSIRQLGITESGPGVVRLLGSHKAKGTFIVHEAMNSTVGLLDDYPHLVGRSLIDALQASDDGMYRRIALGAVNHQRREEYLGRLINEVGTVGYDITRDGQIDIINDRYHLRIIPLQSYSYDTGVAFADQLSEMHKA